jgi:adenosine deaminase
MAEHEAMNVRDAVERMPKVELHTHFGGSIPDETIDFLAEKYGVELGTKERHPTENGGAYSSLIGFLDSYRMRCTCLREEEDFERACIDILTDLKAQNVRYAEIIIAPSAFRVNGTNAETIMVGIASGLKKVRAGNKLGDAPGNGFDARFIFDIGRQFGVEQARQTVREAVENQSRGIIAIGLGGDEIHYSPELFTEQFASAKKQGLHRVAHAGEASGAHSIWGALRSLGAERIGHGVAARGNEPLIEHMRIHQIPIEMCPTSNIKTGAVRSYSDHPLPEFLRRGLLVTLGSDDPAMFGSTITNEYLVCHEKLGLDWDEIKTLCLNGVRASFLPDLYKRELLEQFESELAEIEERIETG